MDKTTQRAEVLNYLKEQGSITSMEAFQLFGATRLSGIIFDLRKHGMNIVTKDIVTTNRYGQRTRYAEYIYIPKEDEV
jgi:hypothetical protein